MDLWTLSKEFRFEASHQLKYHDGKCARLHGHSWVGKLVVVSPRLYTDGPKTNMALDFGDMGKVAIDIVERLDHQHLNEVLRTDMPTSEFLAKWIFDEYKDQLSVNWARLAKVVIEETCTSACTYER